MKIITRIEFQMTDSGLEELFRDEFEYEGPLALAGGGPSAEQKNAANAQTNLANEQGQAAQQGLKFVQDQQAKVNPFYTSRMTNGLPYYNALTDAQSGTVAQAYQPARAALAKQTGAFGPTLPNGFATQAMTDLNESQAHDFDSSLVGAMGANEQAKEAGASGLLGQAQLANPQSYFQGATGANSSILQAPLQRPGIGGILGGAASGLASSIPF